MDVTDLIPKGLGIYWGVFFVGAAGIGLSEFAYQSVPVWCEKFNVEAIPPLDVTGPSSFLAWGVSLLFLLTAVVSLINFRLGKKYDDPKPRVAAWFWLAAAMVFLSMDTQVAFRETFRDVLIAVSGTSVYEDGAVWWLAIYVFALGVIGTRILQDMAAYFPSLGLILLATGCCLVGLALEFELVPQTLEPVQTVMLFTGLKSMAVLLYFLAFTLFARRQVFRDPEVALRWFAKVWNQSPILQTVRELQAAGGQPIPQVAPQPVSPPVVQQPAPVAPAPVAPTAPVTPPTTAPAPSTTAAAPKTTTASGILSPSAGTASGISRPLVQKSTENVSFKAVSGTKKDDDFDLNLLR